MYSVDTLTVSTKKPQLKYRRPSDAFGQFELMVCARWGKLVAWPKSAVLLNTIKPTQDVMGQRPLSRQSGRAKDSMGRAQWQKKEGQLVTMQPTLHELPEGPGGLGTP